MSTLPPPVAFAAVIVGLFGCASESSKPHQPPSPSSSVKGSDSKRPSSAIDAVRLILPANNRLGVVPSQLLEKQNQRGERTFVYVPAFKVATHERLIIWFVLHGKVYALNGATKGSVTPEIPFPREDKRADWTVTGYDEISLTHEGIPDVFER